RSAWHEAPGKKPATLQQAVCHSHCSRVSASASGLVGVEQAATVAAATNRWMRMVFAYPGGTRPFARSR
ncbi:MAG: hypothetical protein WEC54_07515, partial [Gemmatimonadales bacterium]